MIPERQALFEVFEQECRPERIGGAVQTSAAVPGREQANEAAEAIRGISLGQERSSLQQYGPRVDQTWLTLTQLNVSNATPC